MCFTCYFDGAGSLEGVKAFLDEVEMSTAMDVPQTPLQDPSHRGPELYLHGEWGEGGREQERRTRRERGRERKEEGREGEVAEVQISPISGR